MQPKALSDKPKKGSGPIEDRSEGEQKPKKGSCDVKKTTAKVGKKIKMTPQPKKAPKSPEFFVSSKESEVKGPPKDDKG